MRSVFPIICWALLLSSSILYAEEGYIELSPWEVEDVVPIHSAFKITRHQTTSVPTLLALELIEFYQQEVSPQSVSRCPFFISCSDYACQSIRKYGPVLGVCFFIDRHFYRENVASYLHYDLRETEQGVLKLDDSFYLLGKGQ